MPDKLNEYSKLDAEMTKDLWELFKLPPKREQWGWPGAMPSPGHEHEDGGRIKR